MSDEKFEILCSTLGTITFLMVCQEIALIALVVLGAFR